MNPHKGCLHAKVKYRNEPKQVMPKSEDLISRSLEIEPIWTFDTEFQMIYVKWVKHEKNDKFVHKR